MISNIAINYHPSTSGGIRGRILLKSYPFFEAQMARNTGEFDIRTPSIRSNLPVRGEPYYRDIAQGIALGYRRGKHGGAWIARIWDPTKKAYTKSRIGRADDNGARANDAGTFSFDQAAKKAQEMLAHADARRISGVAPKSEKKSVDALLDHYVDGYKSGAARRKQEPGRDLGNLNSILDRHIRPALGHLRLKDLNASLLKAFKLNLVEAPRLTRTGLPVGATKKPPKRAKPAEASAATPMDAEVRRKRQARVNRIITPLRAALNYGRKTSWLASDAAWRDALTPFGAVDGASDRYLELMECQDLQAAAEPDFRNLIRGALMTGCRYGSLRHMIAGDVDLDASTVKARVTKNGKPQVIPLTEAGRAFLRELMVGKKRKDFLFTKASGEQWMPSDQTRPMKRACEAAEIDPPVTFKELRDTFASHLVKRGVPLLTVSKLLGHADIRITEKHYAHLAKEHIHDELRKNLPDF
ncbi:site-specific integrase [Rhodoblastus sp. 17X3]|uniref:tyrosine-type recombinase/integrase n=1 Tax=Rhodoblastus sp. 17X3 TaxID=3047026 RepID=UPI0024B706BC|nr:site-specific integrase [Rhodoblastus sp. 17X3]MDI9849550.1 site-specific integrase [Rhodoblastus sp. 17X3]